VNNPPIIVCYGMGVDSTAMLIGLKNRGIRPDVITTANTKGEKPESIQYAHEVMGPWLERNGFPPITWCEHKTLESTGYDSLAGNCTANETLPSLAFGMKSCSIKWKHGPQDKAIMGCKAGPNQRDPHPIWIAAQTAGVKPVKMIGYDNGPADLRRSKKVIEDENFSYSYPLQEWGWDRAECVRQIIAEGLRVPIKSACFFCPASQKWELWWLAGTHPTLFMEALHMEHTAMIGKHSRWGSDECTYDADWLKLVNEPADQWPTTKITVGLGRKFAWNHWARENGIVSCETGEFIGDREACLAMAEQLRANGGNAHDARTC
jgi:hypothetical protein